MNDQRFWRMDSAAGLFLIFSFASNAAGVVMFTIRGGADGGAPPSYTFFVWERGLFTAAVVLTAIGFVLLEGYLRNSVGRVLARMGAAAYFFAGILLVTAESLIVSTGFDEKQVLALIDIYVVLAFLAQAAIGGAVLQSGILAPWIGWVSILWNLAWLMMLPLITPRDIYFPVLHHFAPLLIGSALLRRATSSQASVQQAGQQEDRVLPESKISGSAGRRSHAGDDTGPEVKAR